MGELNERMDRLVTNVFVWASIMIAFAAIITVGVRLNRISAEIEDLREEMMMESTEGEMTDCAVPDEFDTVDNDISIVCTGFPWWDWTKNIVGSVNVSVDYIHGGITGNIHPTDIELIYNSDLVIYMGGSIDGWIEDLRGEFMRFSLLELLPEDRQMSTRYSNPTGSAHRTTEIEGIYLSLINAQAFCAMIYEILAELDPGNADVYRANLESYADELSELHSRYMGMVTSAEFDTLIFTERCWYKYLLSDYDLNWYEPPFYVPGDTSLIEEAIIESGTRSIMTNDSVRIDIAFAIVDTRWDIPLRIISLNPMIDIGPQDQLVSWATYIHFMESNMHAISDGLNTDLG